MDNTFIKMVDCPEIQDGWKPVDWDWVYCRVADEGKPKLVVLSGYETDGGYYGHEAPHHGEPQCSSPVSNGAYRKGKYNPNPTRNFEREHFWLPRQDQLQEMVDGGFTHQTLERFYQWYHSEISRNLSSMEQLWLAFVMKEKYNKTWDGDKWV